MSSITVDVPNSLLKQAQVLAQQDNTSVDQLVIVALAEKLSALMTEEYLEERARRGSRERFKQFLDKVPDVEPEPHDAL